MNLLQGQYIPVFLLIAVLVAAVIGVISIILNRYTASKMKKFTQAYISIQTFMSGETLEDLLEKNLSGIKELKNQIIDLSRRLVLAENKLRQGTDHLEFVKFNAFDTMGAELSFSLGLFDQQGTGVILTSIHSVEECRIYAKTIEKGQAKVKLSPEEKMVLENSHKGFKI